MTEYRKAFDEWNLVKKNIDSKKTDSEKVPSKESFARAGEIRWVVLGVNVGSEMDAVGPSFNRPCVVVDCFSDRLALVFPLTTKVKNIPGYVPFEFEDGRKGSVCVHQARVISPKRFLKRMTTISDEKLKHLKNEYKKFYRL